MREGVLAPCAVAALAVARTTCGHKIARVIAAALAYRAQVVQRQRFVALAVHATTVVAHVERKAQVLAYPVHSLPVVSTAHGGSSCVCLCAVGVVGAVVRTGEPVRTQRPLVARQCYVSQVAISDVVRFRLKSGDRAAQAVYVCE